MKRYSRKKPSQLPIEVVIEGGKRQARDINSLCLYGHDEDVRMLLFRSFIMGGKVGEKIREVSLIKYVPNKIYGKCP